MALSYGRRLVTRGEPERALAPFERAAHDLGRAGDERGVAVTRGEIADVFYHRGDLDEALRIRREEELPVYERLGDVRERAITWGRIAHIAAAQGDLDTAVELQERRLEANRGLGNLDGIAAALWDLASIDLQRENFEAALPRVAEAYGLLARLGRAEGLAVVGSVHGQFLVAGGQVGEGVVVLQRAADAYRKLGLDDSAQGVSKLLEHIRNEQDEEGDR